MIRLIFLVLALDMASKFWIQQEVQLMNPHFHSYPYQGIGLFQDFFGIEGSLVHTTNSGAAWGLFSHYQMPLLYLRIGFTVILSIFLLFFNKNRRYVAPYSLILAGAIGNIIDFFLYGHVIDMFHFVFWGWEYAVFNIADTAICLGIIWVVILSFFEDAKHTKPTSF